MDANHSSFNDWESFKNLTVFLNQTSEKCSIGFDIQVYADIAIQRRDDLIVDISQLEFEAGSGAIVPLKQMQKLLIANLSTSEQCKLNVTNLRSYYNQLDKFLDLEELELNILLKEELTALLDQPSADFLQTSINDIGKQAHNPRRIGQLPYGRYTKEKQARIYKQGIEANLMQEIQSLIRKAIPPSQIINRKVKKYYLLSIDVCLDDLQTQVLNYLVGLLEVKISRMELKHRKAEFYFRDIDDIVQVVKILRNNQVLDENSRWQHLKFKKTFEESETYDSTKSAIIALTEILQKKNYLKVESYQNRIIGALCLSFHIELQARAKSKRPMYHDEYLKYFDQIIPNRM